jgi:release factor glutamine methyltransferase
MPFTPLLADMRKPLSLSFEVDAVLSNPPYIASCVVDGLERELFFEPRTALDGGEDGLDFYRAILDTHVAPLYLFEIGFDQGEALCALAAARGLSCEILKDLGGRDRVAVVKKQD